MALDPVSIGMTLLGGLLGGQSSSTNQSTSREPWAPAQPWLKSNIAEGQKLQNYYQQNPFNPQQQTGYNNLFGDIDQFRNQVAPGLMGFANSMMGSNYQRARGPVGSAGYGPASPSPLAAQPGPFSLAPGGNFGKVDFAASNPYTNGAIKPPAPAPALNPMSAYDPSNRGQDGMSSGGTPDWGMALQLAQLTGNKALMDYATNGLLGSSNGAARAADAMPSTTSGLPQGYDGPGSNRGGYDGYGEASGPTGGWV